MMGYNNGAIGYKSITIVHIAGETGSNDGTKCYCNQSIDQTDSTIGPSNGPIENCDSTIEQLLHNELYGELIGLRNKTIRYNNVIGYTVNIIGHNTGWQNTDEW